MHRRSKSLKTVDILELLIAGVTDQLLDSEDRNVEDKSLDVLEHAKNVVKASDILPQ